MIIAYNNYNYMALYLYSTLKILQNIFMSTSIPKEPESDTFVQLDISYMLSVGTDSVSSGLPTPES